MCVHPNLKYNGSTGRAVCVHLLPPCSCRLAKSVTTAYIPRSPSISGTAQISRKIRLPPTTPATLWTSSNLLPPTGNPKVSPLSPSYPTLQDSRSEDHTSELQSLMHISYAVFCLNTQNYNKTITKNTI